MAEGEVAHPIRVCTKCGVDFPATTEFFHRHLKGRHGLNPRCKHCVRSENRDYAAANQEKLKAARLKRATASVLPGAAARNRPRVNSEAAKAARKRYAARNPDKAKASAAKYRTDNRRKMREYEIKRHQRLKDDSHPRLLHKRFARLLRAHLHVCGRSKGSSKWTALLGYSLQDLRVHLERQFTHGMSWDRLIAGDIHIDHIVPLPSFQITGPQCPEFRAAWALTNLRPLWARDNLSKGARRTLLL